MPREAPLKESEEQELAARIAAGDRAARDELVQRNIGLVHSLARRRHRGREYEDAIGDGLLELVHCANRFRPGTGRFPDQAVPAISRAMQRKRRHRIEDGYLGLGSISEPVSAGRREPSVDVDAVLAEVLTEPERRAVRRWYGLEGKRQFPVGFEDELRSGEEKLRDLLKGA